MQNSYCIRNRLRVMTRLLFVLSCLSLSVLAGCASHSSTAPASPGIIERDLTSQGPGPGHAEMRIIKARNGKELPSAYLLGMTFPTEAFTRYGFSETTVKDLRESDRVTFLVEFSLINDKGESVRNFMSNMSCAVEETSARCVAAGLLDGLTHTELASATGFKMAR